MYLFIIIRVFILIWKHCLGPTSHFFISGFLYISSRYKQTPLYVKRILLRGLFHFHVISQIDFLLYLNTATFTPPPSPPPTHLFTSLKINIQQFPIGLKNGCRFFNHQEYRFLISNLHFKMTVWCHLCGEDSTSVWHRPWCPLPSLDFPFQKYCKHKKLL